MTKIFSFNAGDQPAMDIVDSSVVEITISDKGMVWVNVDGMCRVRLFRSKSLIIKDRRAPVTKEEQS